MLKKNKKSIKDKIKNYMNNVTIDLFGLEDKVNTNVVEYLNGLTKQSGVEHSLNILISMPGSTPKAHLYHGTRYLREIPIKELLCFFVGEGAALLIPNLESKIVLNVANYLTELADSNNIPLQSLNIRISEENNKVVCEACTYEVFQLLIPLKDLIKYFAK